MAGSKYFSRTSRPRVPRNGFSLVFLAAAILLAGMPGLAIADQPPGGHHGEGVVIVTGSPESALPLGGPAQPYAVLTDLSSFIARDLTATLPLESQIIAPFIVQAGQPVYTIPLPQTPLGQSHPFGSSTSGVQIFSVNAHANLTDGPFLDPADFSGWPTGYSSLDLAPGSFEIRGGTLLVWAPDDNARFPSGFGPDGRLFTEDDPLDQVPAGWTAVTMDQEPFALVRDRTATVPIREGFSGTRDLSAMTYTAAFDALVAELRLRYPFTDLKHLNWDEIVAEYRPRIAAAEVANDQSAFIAALMDFSVEIGDGHLAVAPSATVLEARYGGNAGLRLSQTDYGSVIVTGVADGSSAAQAGLTVGTTILAWNGLSIADALASTPVVQPMSSPQAVRAQRLRLLPLAPANTTIAVQFRLPHDPEIRDATLTATADPQAVPALLGQSPERREEQVELPVTSELLPSGVGYVRVRTFAAPPELISTGWDYAINQFNAIGVKQIIVDVRGNPGGVLGLAAYLAGTFVRYDVNLADLQIADDSGSFVTSGKLLVRPASSSFTGRVALLVDSGCMSACEVLAAAVAANPDHLVIGHEPTAGVMAATFFWLLPGGVTFQAPLGRYEVGGNIWLEGVGVPPSLRVPVTRATLLSDGDPLLETAVTALAN